jgi:G3E family GTPase
MSSINSIEMIPVNIITGFLGAGKTTTIIKILNQKTTNEQWAVIINEFGKISIDSQTLRSSSEAGKVFDISGGCICCSAKGYFHENLTEIIQTGKYSRIIIEPSGLGGIDMVSEIIHTNANLILMPRICLVDILLVENLRLQKLPIYRMQITKSEIIIFTKSDLLNDKLQELVLIKKFNDLYPNKNIQDFSTISTLIYEGATVNQTKNGFQLVTLENKNLDDSNYQKKIFTFQAETVFDIEKLASIFVKHPEILRAKGYIRAKNNWKLMNYTLSACNFEVSTTKPRTDLVLITNNVPQDFFQQFEKEIQETILC